MRHPLFLWDMMAQSGKRAGLPPVSTPFATLSTWEARFHGAGHCQVGFTLCYSAACLVTHPLAHPSKAARGWSGKQKKTQGFLQPCGQETWRHEAESIVRLPGSVAQDEKAHLDCYIPLYEERLWGCCQSSLVEDSCPVWSQLAQDQRSIFLGFQAHQIQWQGVTSRLETWHTDQSTESISFILYKSQGIPSKMSYKRVNH